VSDITQRRVTNEFPEEGFNLLIKILTVRNMTQNAVCIIYFSVWDARGQYIIQTTIKEIYKL
jgi:hypothetical protein